METKVIIHSIYLSSVKEICEKIVQGRLLKSITTPVEVPLDKYDDVLEIMKTTRTNSTQFWGDRIKRGKFNFIQVKKIAKLGKIDLIEYDIYSDGIYLKAEISMSVLILFSCLCWNPQVQTLLQEEEKGGMIKPGMKKLRLSKLLTIDKGRLGASLASSGTKTAFFVLSSHNPLIIPITTGILSSVDVYRYFDGTISKSQLGKNLTVLGVGTVGGLAGATAGSLGGAVIGQILLPIPFVGAALGGFAGGIIGGIAGNAGSSFVTKKMIDKYVEDDEKKMWKLFQEEVVRLCSEYIMSKEEVDEFMKTLRKKENMDSFLDFASAMIERWIGFVLEKTRMTIAIDENDMSILKKEGEALFLKSETEIELNEKIKTETKKVLPPPPPKGLMKKNIDLPSPPEKGNGLPSPPNRDLPSLPKKVLPPPPPVHLVMKNENK